MKKLEIFVYVVCTILILKGGITPEFKSQFRILIELLVYTWSLAVVNLIFCGGALNSLGIRPRTSIGLLGILFSPFLHSSWEHLIANTLPFFILGWFVMLSGIKQFFIITIFILFFGGLGTWLLGRPYTIHVGASGVVFGYLGFLLIHSYFTNDGLSIVLTLLVGFMYGSSLWGIFPTEERISWEGHLFGLLAGVVIAGLLEKVQFALPGLNIGGV